MTTSSSSSISSSSLFPFNQKEHVFDFKVKVNFQNGNISLTAPQIVAPPAMFSNSNGASNNYSQQQRQLGNHGQGQNIYTTPNTSHYGNPSAHPHNNFQQMTDQPPINTYSNIPQSHYPPLQPQPQSLSTSTPQYRSPVSPPLNKPLPQHIQLVNSSYTSMHNQSSDYLNMINNSLQVIQCVLCQKSFNANEFDQHLELHKNKNNNHQSNNKSNIGNHSHITNQKNNVSHYALTQNSFNAGNDSVISGQNNNINNCNNRQNAHNSSFNSNQSNNHNHNHNESSSYLPNFVPIIPSHINQLPVSNNFHNQQTHNQSSHLLGRIDNPILAINAQQQTSMSLNSSSHHQSLSYSNSPNQSMQKDSLKPILEQNNNPNMFLMINQSNGSSFGQHPGAKDLIGPSFYHNSSQESSNYLNNNNNNQNKQPFVKGINRLAYNDLQLSNNNNSIGSHHSSIHSNNFPNNPILPVNNNNNESYHSHHSNHSNHSNQHQYNPSYAHQASNHSINSNHSYNSHNSLQQQQQYIDAQRMMHQRQNQSRNQLLAHNLHSSSFQHQPSYHSHQPQQSMSNSNFVTSSQGNNILPILNQHNNNSQHNNNNMVLENYFQTIQSRYFNQAFPTSNSRQLYSSQQDLTPFRHSHNQTNHRHYYQNQLFNQNDISSISGSSRRDVSDYSDWGQFNNGNNHNGNSKRREDNKEIMHGYNSADNSIIKNIQSRKQEQSKERNSPNNHNHNNNTKNIYLQGASDSKQKPIPQQQSAFNKKKKDSNHMIASTTSYYDKKFKDQDYSSSDQDQFITKTGRLSYVQRLKQKRVTDNSRPLEASISKHSRNSKISKNLKQSSKSINSEDSSLSKTKIPVNYLAREQFISTSTISKSTHKTNLPQN